MHKQSYITPRKPFASMIAMSKHATLVLFIVLLNSIGYSSVRADGTSTMKDYTNQHDDNRQLIVISAPRAGDKYYADVYEQIIEFDIAYANAIMGNDNIVVLADRETLELLEAELPDDVLLEARMRDIWMRDFSTISPFRPMQFRYAAAAQAGSQSDADWVQDGFVAFTDRIGIEYAHTKWILDGGNVVDNHKDKAVVTDRFLEDNSLSAADAKAELKKLLDVEHVAIIPADDAEGLAHADGMLMFIDNNTLALNKYDEPFRGEVIRELEASFPDIEIVEIDVEFDDTVWDENFSSACGINANSLITQNYIYMPTFGSRLDDEVIEKVQANTRKKLIPVNAEKVCFMGGSVRCLGWQIAGGPARKLIEAARAR